jgi:hypothetical protein
MLLWQQAALELGSLCRTSTALDFKTVERRVTHEGLSFLTITLPQFCSDFQKSLEHGFVDSTSFSSFRKRRGLPIFLSGFLSRVFSVGGRLLEFLDIDSIYAIRQLTLMFSKIELPCTEDRVKAAFDAYIQCEKDVRVIDKTLPQESFDRFKRIGRLLYAELFTSLDLKIYKGDIMPRHGPGTTAEGRKANQKYYQRTWPQRLETLFPASEFLFPSPSFWREAQRVDILEPGREVPVRVITVPKTLKTPRIIAIEPVAMQYMQQGILELLVEGIKSDKLLYGLIGFDDQTPNQDLARQGSCDRSLATLDLKEASDRVSNQHVRGLLENHPWLLEAVDATRSRKADVPHHGVIRLAKFASMGSALCFPFEAMTFLVCCFMGIEDELRRPLTRRDFESFMGRVRVYGDDIIVPVEFVHSVVRCLELFGFKVGRNKSFWNGYFRESCGKEYYAGHDVSVVRVRKVLPQRRTDSQELVSTVALRNNFYLSGMWQCARHLDQLLAKFLDLPVVAPTSPSLGKYSLLGYETQKMSADLHAPLVRGYRVVPRLPKSHLSGPGALLKFFLKRGEEPLSRDHLVRTGRPLVVDIIPGWVQPF